jgi:uncharacterized membrane protein
MKKKTKIIIGIVLVVIIWIILYVWYVKYNQNTYWENIKNLYLNNGNNENIEVPSQIDE